MATTMKAIGFDHFGGPEQYKEVTLPIPKATGQDLLVKVYSFALNPVDNKSRMGLMVGAKPGDPVPAAEAPKVVGWDAAGVVTAIGPNVKNFKVGDAVYFAGNVYRAGSYAEYVLVDERIAALKPKSLDWNAAASVPLVALTAYEGMHEQMHIPFPTTPADAATNAKKSILLVAGAGGVGSFASQLAKHVFKIGTVISTASRPESVQFCKEHGADYTITHTMPLAPQLKELGSAAVADGVDYVFNLADHSDPDELIALLKPMGTYCTIVGFPVKNPNMQLPLIFAKRLTVTAEFMFGRPVFNVEPEKQHALLTHVADLIDKKVVKHTCTKVFTFSLDEVKKAAELQATWHHMGKIAVSVLTH